jgi:hypothetical protein
VTLSVSTPAVSPPFPAIPGPFTDLPSPMHLTIAALDSLGQPQQPLKAVLISVINTSFNFATVPGALDISRFDESHGVWVPLATTKFYNQLSAVTNHLSSFAVLSLTPAAGVADITVGPNPLRPVVNPGAVMTFRHLPAGARVRIFSYVGEKLVDLDADAGGTAGWDGRNRRGNFVASGVYIAVIEGGGTSRTLRVAIER